MDVDQDTQQIISIPKQEEINLLSFIELFNQSSKYKNPFQIYNSRKLSWFESKINYIFKYFYDNILNIKLVKFGQNKPFNMLLILLENHFHVLKERPGKQLNGLITGFGPSVLSHECIWLPIVTITQ